MVHQRRVAVYAGRDACDDRVVEIDDFVEVIGLNRVQPQSLSTSVSVRGEHAAGPAGARPLRDVDQLEVGQDEVSVLGKVEEGGGIAMQLDR